MTVKVAVDEPAETVTVPGTEADWLDDDKTIEAPPAEAFPLSVTVAVGLVPPTTELGATVTDDTCRG